MPSPFGLHLRHTNFARHAPLLTRALRSLTFGMMCRPEASAVTRSTPLAASFLRCCQPRQRHDALRIPKRWRNRCPLSLFAWCALPCREVCMVCRSFVFGPCFLYRLRLSVTPFPLWTVLPSSESSGVIRLPLALRPPFLGSGGSPCLQASLGSPTFSALRSLHARPCGPRQTRQHLARPMPLCWLPVRENRRRLH